MIFSDIKILVRCNCVPKFKLARMFTVREFVTNVCNSYHLLNLLLSVAFPLFKLTPISRLLSELVRHSGPPIAGLDSREREILMFLAIIIIWKNRKSASYLHALSTAYLFSKLANAVLFFRSQPIFGIIYSMMAILLYMLVPEQLPPESNQVYYFQEDELRRTMEQDRNVVWIIEFFSTWSPECRYVAPVFSTLGEKFSLPNLRFGKVDLGKYPREGVLYRVNSSATSKQLPTIVCFKNGQQTERRPLVGQNHRAIPFVFSQENIILALDLNNTYTECKNKMKKRERMQEENVRF